MQLQEYFENASGVGVMSTADSGGKVDSAIYARPHVMADGTIAFIMRDRLTHPNLQENPYAVYLFNVEYFRDVSTGECLPCSRCPRKQPSLIVEECLRKLGHGRHICQPTAYLYQIEGIFDGNMYFL